MRLTRYENCFERQPITFQLIFNTSADNSDQTQYSGVLDIRKNLSEPLELTTTVRYCRLNAKTCMNLPTQLIPNICHHLNDTEAFYAGFMSNIKPKFVCPLKSGRYVVPKATLDLPKLSFTPIPASTWTMTLKLYSVNGGKKTLAFCAIIEYRIAVAKSRNRKRN